MADRQWLRMGHKARAVPRHSTRRTRMTETITNKNGFAQDMLKMFTISDRTHKAAITYFTEKFIKDCKYNLDNPDTGKRVKVMQLMDNKLNHFIDHKEKGTMLDHDYLLQCDRDIDWLNTQIELAENLQAYLEQALEQLVPDELAKSQSVASSIKDLEAQYKAIKAA